MDSQETKLKNIEHDVKEIKRMVKAIVDEMKIPKEKYESKMQIGMPRSQRT